MNIQIIKDGDEIKLSNNITAYFFGVPHTIPETTGVMLKTPIGNIVHFADFRLDYDDEGNPHGLEEFETPRQDGRAHFHGGQHERGKAGPLGFGKDR